MRWDRDVNFQTLKKNYHSKRHFLQNLHLANPGVSARPFVYMKNHKAACSTIIATLLRQTTAHDGAAIGELDAATIHSPPKRLLATGERGLNVDQAEQALNNKATFKFTFVRDPVSRTVSAFADKMGAGSVNKRRLMQYVGRPEEDTITLSEFLDIIAQDAGALDLDRHWRPQSKEISYDQIAYDFIGRVENLTADLGHVVQTCFSIEKPMIEDTRKTIRHTSDSRKLKQTLTREDKRNLETALEADLAMYDRVSMAV
ncbi:sulfotransferase family 2 domain-containing protein [Roseovarius sp. MMSF_3281]|uniref:sulfotransferase family 2 domain-containing protein n=1 Tax=Roseovarius sp. MMSF_3281 TaxID=3046694 RepID=UPI00273EB6DD|nr:sulfotransferase family 2 domain-containing protein [Roseovarius sp. MMSF_3281]